MDKFYDNEISKLSYDESVTNAPNDMPYEAKTDEKFDIKYVLSRIDKIHQDGAHIMSAISAIGKIEPSSGAPGDNNPGHRAEAIADVVKSREETNQKLLDLYTRMYEDMNPSRVSMPSSPYDVEMKRIDKVAEIMANTDLSEVDDEFYTLMAELAGTKRK